ncbi:MAG: bifunctional methylenetetrahydrofolate dehydrogenase/methenyltetrahydrofolate cyclohydrolase FolD [Geminicoccaceae bacterium]|nr:bifunctional methylenetetrahydrofolate dehydrogenase/methenyltetrahydrofolate cyclohydrolase FolD [Geminicoccaceae bacterium]MCX8099669.1 bifunctional methylenetetrahydrofolate dehydrogenase/methenyltetrahydrofolate cyclohydrolase FolD [Geminicoccaceae bacterium]MDW8370906.1 bifunctional methylenetetrahydrofolate dehydrogenase/methenyltetrahydrofolate cyclohydrolase FolD [Geminicoccaceae bacterium]
MTRILDGRALAARVRARVAAEVAELRARTGRVPGLRVLLLGEHPASLAYVRTKERMAREVGIDGRVERLPSDTTEAALLARLAELDADPAVDGILVQLPLPAHIDTARVLAAIAPGKDVDGFHPLNAGRLAQLAGPPPEDLLVPCTPRGCLLLLEEALGSLEALRGRRALVLGRSTIVGRPMAALLLAHDATVTIAHSRTRELAAECRRAEILVAAVGRPELVRGDWIAPGAVVIDVGINRIPTTDGGSRLVGDVAFAEALGRAAAITPVPGGVGPMTVACLLDNTLRACRARLAGGR